METKKTTIKIPFELQKTLEQYKPYPSAPTYSAIYALLDKCELNNNTNSFLPQNSGKSKAICNRPKKVFEQTDFSGPIANKKKLNKKECDLK